MWSLLNCHHSWKLYLQFTFFAFGVYASRINTALIAVTLVLAITQNRCFVMKLRPLFILIGFVTPGILVLIMLVIVHQETPPHGAKVDPNFQYGSTQAMLSLVLLSVSFITTILSLIIAQRAAKNPDPIQRSSSEDDPTRYLLEDNVTNEPSEPIIDVEDIQVDENNPGCSSSNHCRARRGAGRYRCDSEQRDYNSSLLERYTVPPANEAIIIENLSDDFDIVKHTILLLLLSFSMFVGIALCIWTLVMEQMSGIYVELVFLDGFLNFGQGLFIKHVDSKGIGVKKMVETGLKMTEIGLKNG